MDYPNTTGQSECDDGDTGYYFLVDRYNIKSANQETIIFKRLSINIDTLEDTIVLKKTGVFDSVLRDENLCDYCDCFYETTEFHYSSQEGMIYYLGLSANESHPKFRMSFKDIVGPQYGLITLLGEDDYNLESFMADRGDTTYLRFHPDSGLTYYFNKGIQVYELKRVN